MAEQRMVQTAFWYDDYVSSLTRDERYFFLYVLTNPHTNIAWVYQIWMRYVALETGFSEPEILAMFAKFEADGKMRYEKWWIAVKQWLKHQKQGSAMIRKGIDKYVSSAPAWCGEYVWRKRSPEPEQDPIGFDEGPEGPETHGDPEVSECLQWMLERLGLDDFKEDNRKQRLRAKHVVDLKEKIGGKEFARRWKAVVGDDFKRRRCNSIDYLYSELRSQTGAPSAKKKGAGDGAGSEEAEEKAKRERERKENAALDAKFESFPEDLKEIVRKEAARLLAEVGVTPESDSWKGRKAYESMLLGKIRLLTSKTDA